MKRCGSKKIALSALALFVLLSIGAGICCASSRDGKCNIVLITIDALRADHLSCYGYERKTTPVIDSLAEEGIVCSSVYAPSSWTAPSVASLFTSVYPVNHGVAHGIRYVQDETRRVQEVFSPELTTLTEVLKANGYITFGVASNFHLSEKLGFARGFDYFTCLDFKPAQEVNKAVYVWKDKIKNAQKFFLWIHYVDPHYPYTGQSPWIRAYTSSAGTGALLNMPPQTWWDFKGLVQKVRDDPKLLAHLIALYDSEINFADAHVGELMERFNLHEDALLVITSDHGEEFLEHHQTGHGRNLYQQTVHIPLIIKLPGHSDSSVLNKPLSLIDVMPTILDIAGIDAPATLLGNSFLKKNSLFSWLKEKMVGVDKTGYIYTELDTTAHLKAILAPPWKYIYNYGDETGQLYDIMSDPLELDNLADEKTVERDRLKEQLFHWVDTAKRYPFTAGDVILTPDEKERLKGLGYLQ
jgi:arylsulfatase A-like enzyme